MIEKFVIKSIIKYNPHLRNKSSKNFVKFNKYRNLSKSTEFCTFQDNLGFSLYIIFFTSCVVEISEENLRR